MALYAIGDLHLSFSTDKPMDIFGENWVDYEAKVRDNWLNKIKEDDWIIIPGDISWALRLEEAEADLKWIGELPGHKILMKGNHDYWWTSVGKMSTRFPDLHFLHNNFFAIDDVAVCGTRGWICPGEGVFSDEDRKVYNRELIRLELSLSAAYKAGYRRFIVAMHYPPTNDRKEKSGFVEIIEKYGVETVLYGHLHTKASFDSGLKGEVEGVRYMLTSSDYLDFDPVMVMEDEAAIERKEA